MTQTDTPQPDAGALQGAPVGVGTAGTGTNGSGGAVPGTSGKARRRRRNADGTMPLIEHIYEFRTRLLISVAAVAVFTGIGFWWYGHTVLGLPSLGSILTGPYCSVPAASRADLGGNGDCRLLATGPFEQFMLRLKVGATAGIVLSSPVWLYEIWAFIVPGLHKKERRYGVVFTFLAALLFMAGAVMAYLVVSHALDFLLSIGDQVQTTALSGAEYFNFIIHLILIFGVSFEIPLLIAMLNVVGVVRYEWLKKARRGIIMAIFVFAAVASPGQDPFSMLALAVAVCVLVEISIQFARFNDRRRSKDRPDWLDVDDESASPIGVDGGPGANGGSAPLGAPAPVSGSGPVDASGLGWSPQNRRGAGPHGVSSHGVTTHGSGTPDARNRAATGQSPLPPAPGGATYDDVI